MPEAITVRRLLSVSEPELLALSDVLCDCVAGGASVSFMQPFSLEQALHYWRGVSVSVAHGERALLVAENAGRIVGTVQVVLGQPDNQPHRGDVSKMLVARAARRHGVGARLMAAAETTARACGKTLLVLDTASADAERLYQRMGWTRLGVIPGYALLPEGGLCDTTYYYRILPPSDAVLDNPVWHALVSAQRGMAQLHGLAARFRADISPLAGLREPTTQALEDLRALAAPGEQLWLLSDGPLALPPCWREVRARYIDQMVSTGAPSVSRSNTGYLELGDADVADMAALVELTKPGPFEAHTRDMGAYLGVREADGKLVAMSGQRMNLTHYREISAVCSHPDARGRGLTAPLMTELMERIVAEGKTPFLHVKTENGGAKAVYQKLGFTVRRAIYFSIIAAV
ncbi:MAG: GNAT family N-acetyltransferase [Burkholderiaceae bacterium]|nr:GNAT family N-acetyltransferase [Burkholderiaceae bacterium]